MFYQYQFHRDISYFTFLFFLYSYFFPSQKTSDGDRVIVVRHNDPNYIAGIYYITVITEVRARVHTGVPMRTHVKIFVFRRDIQILNNQQFTPWNLKFSIIRIWLDFLVAFLTALI
jgi:hypothetical protein